MPPDSHPNTAFGLSFAFDYARAAGDKLLQGLVDERSRIYCAEDVAIPAAWEPGGDYMGEHCLATFAVYLLSGQTQP